MGNLSNILVIVFCLGAVFSIASIGIIDINPTNSNVLFDCDNTIMRQYGTCSNTDLNGAIPNTDASLVTANLPTVDTSNSNAVTVVVQTVSNIFSSIGSWISQTLGLGYLQVAMDTPRLILTAIGLPAFFVWALGGLITALIVFFFIDWMKGAFA